MMFNVWKENQIILLHSSLEKKKEKGMNKTICIVDLQLLHYLLILISFYFHDFIFIPKLCI